MSRNKLRWIVVCVSVLGCTIAFLIFAHWYLLDGLDGWFFSLGEEDNTTYSAGYSDGHIGCNFSIFFRPGLSQVNQGVRTFVLNHGPAALAFGASGGDQA